MRIIQVLPFFGPKFGGSFVSLSNISRELAKKGHDVTILTTDYQIDYEYRKFMEKAGVKVIPFHCSFNLGLFLFSPSMKGWLKKNLKSFDIIHMQTFRSYQNSVICDYAKQFNIPYIVQARGSMPLETGKKVLKQLYDSLWGKKLLNGSSKVIALNETEKRQYIGFGMEESKIEIIPNGIDVSIFSDLPKKGNFRNKYHIGNNEKLILYLGQIHKIKGIQILLESFSSILKENECDIKLAIVGPDSGYLSSVEKLIHNLGIERYVVITGPIYGDKKLSAYVDADVYVLPSMSEGFPNTVLEAAACGTPVVVTDRCGVSEIVKEFGYVVPYDAYSLRYAIKNILNGKFNGKVGMELSMLIKNRFSLENIIDDIGALYESILIED